MRNEATPESARTVIRPCRLSVHPSKGGASTGAGGEQGEAGVGGGGMGGKGPGGGRPGDYAPGSHISSISSSFYFMPAP